MKLNMIVPYSIVLGMLIILLTGCGVATYQYPELEYKHYEIYDYPPYPAVPVYIPRHRPYPLYRFDGFYYDEPYTYMLYREKNGRVRPRKIPNSILRKIHQSHQVHPPPVKQKKKHIFTNPTVDQESNRRITRQRTRRK